VDVPRKRIGLSMRKDGGASAKQERNARDAGDMRGRGGSKGGPKGGARSGRGAQASPPKADTGNSALGAALLDAMKKK
jgi:uncharacterized protein